MRFPSLQHLPSPLYRAARVRELDRVAIEDFGMPGMVLMERAGLASFQGLLDHWPGARRLAVVCGIGNNGGDGFVLARRAREAGFEVVVSHVGDITRLQGDALEAHRRMVHTGVVSLPFSPDLLGTSDVIVDALFGTGLDREVEGAWYRAIEAMNQHAAPVLAVDIPSGLHADTGRILGIAARAQVTVSFIGLKQGMFTGQGPEACGRILFDDLAVPAEIYARVGADAQRIQLDQFDWVLQRRSRTAHKGDYGHVLVIGGDYGFAGAARLAGEAAARTGAGLVSVATRREHVAGIVATRPELMCHAVETRSDLGPILERATVIAVGPGLGRSEWARGMLDEALASTKPIVVDADALNLMAGSGERVSRGVLTPHPGEAARLLGASITEVQADRFEAAREVAARCGGVCVLKGAGTLITGHDGKVAVAVEGNPGMASGGMGDTLTGIISGLMAQGLDPVEAARLGVCIHGRAADLAAAQGERGLLAADVLAWLRPLVNGHHVSPGGSVARSS